MAGASLLTLLDDITTLTKIAAKKTSGVVGDDLALNAEQVAGVNAERELPIVFNVAKGSLKNKAILIPTALILSAVAPALITPLLMIGGLYLCYEGSEKIIETIQHKLGKSPHGIEDDVEEIQKHHHPKELNAKDEAKVEKEKVAGAIKTDFVLSGEIIIIALGTVAGAPLLMQAGILTVLGVVMTVGVYGVVAGIVKADDVGLFLSDLNKENFVDKMNKLNEKTKNHHPLLKMLTVPTNAIISTIGKTFFNNEPSIKALNFVGEKAVAAIPYFMKALTVVGTVAMFSVGGSILAHGMPFVHGLAAMLPETGVLGTISGIGLDIGVGVACGVAAVVAKEPAMKVLSPVLKALSPVFKPVLGVVEKVKDFFKTKPELDNSLSVEKRIDSLVDVALKEENKSFLEKSINPKKESSGIVKKVGESTDVNVSFDSKTIPSFLVKSREGNKVSTTTSSINDR